MGTVSIETSFLFFPSTINTYVLQIDFGPQRPFPNLFPMSSSTLTSHESCREMRKHGRLKKKLQHKCYGRGEVINRNCKRKRDGKTCQSLFQFYPHSMISALFLLQNVNISHPASWLSCSIPGAPFPINLACSQSKHSRAIFLLFLLLPYFLTTDNKLLQICAFLTLVSSVHEKSLPNHQENSIKIYC